jgi:hypothetical protein
MVAVIDHDVDTEAVEVAEGVADNVGKFEAEGEADDETDAVAAAEHDHGGAVTFEQLVIPGGVLAEKVGTP